MGLTSIITRIKTTLETVELYRSKYAIYAHIDLGNKDAVTPGCASGCTPCSMTIPLDSYAARKLGELMGGGGYVKLTVTMEAVDDA